MKKRCFNINYLLLMASVIFPAAVYAASDDGSTDIGIQIVGGEPATEGEHPWMVYMSTSSSGSNSFCGGSLIAADWVLTAAHCIVYSTNYVVAGVYNRNNATSAKTFSVENISVHPGFSNVAGGDDIALLKLAEPVPTSLVSQYAQLPSTAFDNAYVGTGDLLKVIGWGTTSSGGSSSNTLLEVSVPVTSESYCDSAYGSIDYDTQVCAGFTNGGKDSCQGDSGGPLLFSLGGQDYVAGIVSYGQGCASAGFPGVYTRTAGFLNWVASIVDDDNGGGDTVTELFDGNSVSISGSSGDELYFSIQVPSGAELTVNTSGGSGDADLYTRFGALPTTSNYDCRPYANGNNESCSDTNSAGTYYIMVRGYSSFSGVTLSVNYDNDDDGGNTGGGGVVEGLSASTSSWTQAYTVTVPNGMSSLDVDISGSNGDADLYVYYNSEPTSTVSSSVSTSTRCVPWIGGSNESCSFSNPSAGTWYVRVYGYSTFSDVTLEVNYAP